MVRRLRDEEFWADGSVDRPEFDFFNLKGVVEALTADLHLPAVSYRPAKTAHLHPGKAADLLVKGQPVGSFGQLHPKASEAFGLSGRVVLVGEFDLDAILKAVPERYKYVPVPRFPAALRDIAVIVDEAVTAEQVVKEIRGAGGAVLASLRLFDVFRGDSIAAGTKSLAYALTYQADDRTLTDKEVDKVHKKIEDRLKNVLKAQIRGQDMIK